ncbi:MAG TPA: FAD-dependent oxidoreductase [Jatrophihabitans sp.]|nr:FAD-dependent oxidoreductase [Jatrophihabitans sp.]
MDDGFVIVGAGLAGAKAAEALRQQGYDGRLTLIGNEQHRPYERPPLSKAYLARSQPLEKAYVHPAEWYAEHEVDLRTGTRATAIDPAGHRVRLADGGELGYRKLLLATGSSPRSLPLAGLDAPNVHTLRSVADSDALAESFAGLGRLLVIGAGWIGLEVAAVARQAGAEVSIVEAAELPLLRVLGPELAEVFADLHREHGVDLRLGARLTEVVTEAGRVTGLRLADGTVLSGDALLVAVGAAPNVQLAADAGLAVDNGVLVDAGLVSSDPDVLACGDIANAFAPFYDRRIRVEHWATALKQPVTAARSMRGETAGYDELPYFYSDQYDLGMEYLGYVEPDGYDQVVFRGDRASREFIAFWLADGRVIAGMNVNVWDVTDPIKALIRSRRPVDPARLADPAVALEDL